MDMVVCIVKPPDLFLKWGDFAFHSGLTQL